MKKISLDNVSKFISLTDQEVWISEVARRQLQSMRKLVVARLSEGKDFDDLGEFFDFNSEQFVFNFQDSLAVIAQLTEYHPEECVWDQNEIMDAVCNMALATIKNALYEITGEAFNSMVGDCETDFDGLTDYLTDDSESFMSEIEGYNANGVDLMDPIKIMKHKLASEAFNNNIDNI